MDLILIPLRSEIRCTDFCTLILPAGGLGFDIVCTATLYQVTMNQKFVSL